jgi:predicted metal-dependent enzyme (double-stranded beta helix superfamily)
MQTTTTSVENSPKRCAIEIAALLEESPDFTHFADAVIESVQRLLGRHDLVARGIPRRANHAADSAYLYYDEDLSITIARMPNGHPVPIHDHGVWQILGLYRGSMDHVLYERTDDGTRPGLAELKITDERTIASGDVVVMRPPPCDIHEFTALSPDTYILAIVPGDYCEVRKYFDPETSTYFERHEKLWRASASQ